jgi:glycosyltransferase involved in cell wall biosynthesis
MRVTVIIPTYNSSDLVVEAVESVLAQTVPPAEIVLVDDGSTDDTRARLSSFGPPLHYIYQENGGVASARNRGIKEATGDLIAFLDADDAWHPRKLEIQLQSLQRHPELGMLGTARVDWPTQAFPSLEEVSIPEPVEVALDELVVRNRFVTSSIVIRREVLDRVGEFDGLLHGPEDYDMWLRAGQVAPIANIPLQLIGYRDVEGSLSKRAVSMESGLRRIRSKLVAAGVFKRRPIFRASTWSFLQITCAHMYRVSGNRAKALRLTVNSLLAYPLPFRRGDVNTSFTRLRMLRAIVLPPVQRGEVSEHQFDGRYAPEQWTRT